MKEKVLVLVGPTAVGKSELAVKLAHEFDAEIISADSQQVYRGLDVGTAKVTTEEMQNVPHHLIDVRDLDENFSAHDFVQAAAAAIKDILSRGKLPIIVGGTGLYIQALTDGYHLGGEENHAEMRQLREKLEIYSDAELRAALKIPLIEFNRRRAIRAIELQEFGYGENSKNREVDYDFCLIGLEAAREILYERINQRVDRMLETRLLLDEARLLYDGHQNAQAAKAIGYKEFFPYFAGELSLVEVTEKLKQDTRRYAKRQLTWFKNRMQVKFYDIFSPDFPENVIMGVREFLKSDKV
jgi:tRNA dimethylallyltransferase